MNRVEHLLTILSEECAEVAQRIAKAQRFGMDECQPGQPFVPPLDNRTRIIEELNDLWAVAEMLDLAYLDRAAVNAKKVRVEHFMRYSEFECGTLKREESGE